MTMLTVPVPVGDPVAEIIIVGTDDRLESDGFVAPTAAEADSEAETALAEIGVDTPSLAVETAIEAADSALATEAERALRGMTGMGMCAVTEAEVAEAISDPVTDAAEATAFVASVVWGTSVPVAEPATLLATRASCEAAAWALEAMDAASDPAVDAIAGVWATMLTGAIVTGPVGMEALAGSWMEVV